MDSTYNIEVGDCQDASEQALTKHPICSLLKLLPPGTRLYCHTHLFHLLNLSQALFIGG